MTKNSFIAEVTYEVKIKREFKLKVKSQFKCSVKKQNKNKKTK